MKTNYPIFFSLLALALCLNCQSQADLQLPQLDCNEKFKSTSTIASALINLPSGYISQDLIAEAYISADNADDNFDTGVFVQDLASKPNLGLKLNLSNPNTHNDYPLGSKISLKLKGLYLQHDENGYELFQGLNSSGKTLPLNLSQFYNISSRACQNDKPAVLNVVPVIFTSVLDLKKDIYLGQLVQVNKLKLISKDPKNNKNNLEFFMERYQDSSSFNDNIELIFDKKGILEAKVRTFLANKSSNKKIVWLNLTGILLKADGIYYLKPRSMKDCIENKS